MIKTNLEHVRKMRSTASFHQRDQLVKYRVM
uniref:Uncharacterized protein n=1 Tax=Arundo donax TaxID=35708 RepID=A0A0A9B9X5_ARUDO